VIHTTTAHGPDRRVVATVTVGGGAREPQRIRVAAEVATYLARPRIPRTRACCVVVDRTPRSGIII
jgi:hypothetical protein